MFFKELTFLSESDILYRLTSEPTTTNTIVVLPNYETLSHLLDLLHNHYHFNDSPNVVSLLHRRITTGNGYYIKLVKCDKKDLCGHGSGLAWLVDQKCEDEFNTAMHMG